MRKDYIVEFNFCKHLITEIGDFLMAQNSKNVINDDGKDIKLDLDLRSESKIVDALRQRFNHTILTEEAGLLGSLEENKCIWIIDPIDGTLNYSRNNPSCCVSIALWSADYKPIFGLIYDFNRKELFTGHRDYGAYINEENIHISSVKNRSESILATGFPTYLDHSEENLSDFIGLVKEFKKIRVIGSAALSLAYVACGRFDSYYERSIKLWDVAAGLAIISAVGIDYNLQIKDNFETITNVRLVE